MEYNVPEIPWEKLGEYAKELNMNNARCCMCDTVIVYAHNAKMKLFCPICSYPLDIGNDNLVPSDFIMGRDREDNNAL